MVDGKRLEPSPKPLTLRDRHPGALRRGVPRPRNAGAADERKYRLLQGYKRAGDILIQNALADLYDRDSLIFPAIFNYRHLLSCI